MISREELELLILGAAQQAALGVESAHGRALTRTEIAKLTDAIANALRMAVDRCAAAKLPPPPPAALRAPRPANPLLTQELRPVTDEDIRKATVAGLSPVKPK